MKPSSEPLELSVLGPEPTPSWLRFDFLLARGHMVRSPHTVGAFGSFLLPPNQADSLSNL